MQIKEKNYISFKQAIIDFWKGYFNFSGSSTRSGFWWGRLSVLLIEALIILCLSPLIYQIVKDPQGYVPVTIAVIAILLITAIIFCIPSLALQVRRLRNVGLNNITIVIYYIISIILYFLVGNRTAGIAYFISDLLDVFLFICNLLPSHTLSTIPIIGIKNKE